MGKTRIRRPVVTDPTCLKKTRWPCQASATAGAIHVLEYHAEHEVDPLRQLTQLTQLFVYRCPHCAGWHLTKRATGEAITLGAI